MRDSDTAGREGTGERGQAAKSKTFEVSQPFLRDPRPKRNHRSVKFASKRSVSVYRGFPSRCTLNCNRIDPAVKKKDRERLIAGLTIARRKEKFSSKVSFALYFSLPLLINFIFHGLFFCTSSVLA